MKITLPAFPNLGFRQRLTGLLLVIGLLLAAAPTLADETSGLSDAKKAHNRALVAKLLKNLPEGQETVDFGCMILHVDQLRALGGLGKAGFIVESDIPDVSFYWPNGTVHYTFDPAGIEDGTTDANGNIASGRKEIIREAIADWEEVAALNFVEVPFNNPGVANYIIFKDHPTKNSSLVGKWPLPAPQDINMVSWDHPATKFVIIHEIGHALGLFHEQSRSDRDAFVDIIEANITAGHEHNFDLEISDNVGPYDFLSVMHYPYNAFGIDGQTTIEPLPAYQEFKFQMGQRSELSEHDAAGMAAKYGERPQTTTYPFSPDSGAYTDPVQFRIFVLPIFHPGNIRYFYTLDGSEPTLDSPEWFPGDVILINSDTTVKYFALQEGKTPSDITTATYTFPNSTPRVDTPVITPAGGSYQGSQLISISTTTPDAEIRYNLGTLIPSQESTLYTGPFTITSGTTVKARGFKAGHDPSGVATQVYTITAPTLDQPPTILPVPGGQVFQAPLTVSITTPISDGTIRYTLDGNDPTAENSFVYDGLVPINLTQNTTVRAKVFRPGSDPSPTASEFYTVLAAAPPPSINPNGGTFTGGSVEVSMSAPEDKSEKGTGTSSFIYYTLNGSDPQTYSEHYTGPFTLGLGNHIVRARTILPGINPSAVISAPITVLTTAPDLDPPTFRPVVRDHVNSVEVSIDHFTEDAKVFYTVGEDIQPADPDQDSTLYEGPFTLEVPAVEGAFYFLKAKAFGPEGESAVAFKTYSVFKPFGEISAPEFDPSGNQTYNNPITVTMSADSTTGPGGILIFRTTNGDDPVVPDPPTGGNVFTVDLNRNTNLKAIAYRNIYGESEITSRVYTFQCAAPVIEAVTAKQTASGSIEVVMSSETVGGSTQIRYEIGGGAPTVSSTPYTTPIVLDPGVHVIKARTFRLNFTPSSTTTASFIVETTPEAPVILLDPLSAEIEAFTDHTFITDATGVPDPSYRWYFQPLSATEPIRLAGETNLTLTLYNVGAGAVGDYFMVASNSTGAATTEIASLVVTGIETPTPTATPTATATVEGTATETPTPTATDVGSETPTPTPTDPGENDFDCDEDGSIDGYDLLCLVQRWQDLDSQESPASAADLLEFLNQWRAQENE